MKADDWSDPIIDGMLNEESPAPTRSIENIRIPNHNPPVPHYRQVEDAIGVAPHNVAQEYSYNIGTALVYLLRSPYKHDNPKEDYEKAIDHIRFELERL